MSNLFLFNAFKDIKNSWKSFLINEIKKDYFYVLDKKIERDFSKNIICPKYEDIFNAFKYFELEETKLVILGQDPYHIRNMADGLAFSTKLKLVPKSLSNIFNEIKNDFGIQRTNSDLSDIASQNVLLLNTILTVKETKPLSHKNFGWEIFSQNLIKYLSSKNKNIIYLLMGNNAIRYEKYIVHSLKIFKTSHPSPFSYHLSLKNSEIFKKINDILGNEKIIW